MVKVAKVAKMNKAYLLLVILMASNLVTLVMTHWILKTELRAMAANNVQTSQGIGISALPKGDDVSRVKEAEAVFARYERDPTNELAVLCLQTAIRKAPTNLKYVKALKKVVEESGMDSALVQEYQAMLSYSLDMASENCFDELASMVKELRVGVAKRGEELPVEDEVDDHAATVEALKKRLEQFPLLVRFDETAMTNAEVRMEVYKQLIPLDGDEESRVGNASAELIYLVGKTKSRVNGYMSQARWEIERAVNVKPAMQEESDLREVLDALGATAVSQPIILAQQAVQGLYGIDLSQQPTDIVATCVEEFRRLDNMIQKSQGDADKKKSEKIIEYVQSIKEEDSQTIGRKYTKQLRHLEKQGKVISKYIGCIANTESANEALNLQLEILKKSREVQRERMKGYQSWAADEMKTIAAKIKEYKDKAWRKEFKKNSSEPLLRKLVRIDPALLVPEINELYQYEYSQLTSDFNAWIEKKNDFEYKATFMVELERIEKVNLEDM